MKSKCSFILKASTALVLALLMLFGTVTTSVAAVVDNAKNTAEADATEPEAHGAEGFFAMLRKQANLAETGATTIYFDDTNTKWGSVYVWSSSSSYWNNSKGSGSSGRTLTKMSKVSGTSNLYSASLSSTGAYVAFVKDNQANYDNFYNTKAAYRGDFATTKPVYIPYATSSGTYNGTSYYSNGEWTYAPVTYSEDAVVYYKMGSWWTNTTCYEYVGLTTFGASTSMVPAYNLTTYLNGSNATNGSKSTAGSATTTTYFATIPAGTYYHTWFERKKSDSASADSYNATSNTAALSTSKNTNTTALTADSTQVTLNSTTSNAPIITETASSTSVNAGVEVTLGASMTKNADLNVLDSVTYAVTSSNSSTATITGNKFTATAGGTYTVTATGTYHAKGYSSLSGTVTDTVDITVTVTVPAHSVTREAPTNGTLQLSADGTNWGTSALTIAEGANYYVKVTPNTGYKVSALNVGGSAVAAAAGSTSAYTYTGTMGTSDVATSATFAIQTFNVKKTESGASGGTVKVGNTTIGTTNTSVNYGTNYTVTVTAPSGYNVKSVSGVTGTTTGLNTSSVSITGVTINADKTIAVIYESAGSCGLSVTQKYFDNGTIATGNKATVTGAGTYAYNASVTVSVSSVNSDYAFVGWYNAGAGNDTAPVSTNTSYTFTMPDSNKSLEARFRKKYYLTAYSSWVPVGGDFSKVAAPPTKVEVLRGTTVVATYTYSHLTAPDNTGEDAALITASGTFHEGNKLQILGGYNVKLYYSALGSSEAIRGIFFNNGIRYTMEGEADNSYTNGSPVTAGTGTDDNWKYTYEAATTLFADENLYSNTELVENGTYAGQPKPTAIAACKSGYQAEVDQSTHIVSFTAAQNYRNIDLELGSKFRVFFANSDGAVIQSKNLDNYYSMGEQLSGSTEATYFTIKAEGNTDQINSIDKDAIKVYPADSAGNKTSTTPITPFTFTYSSGSTAITNGGTNGKDDSTAYIKITGTMPNQNVVIEINPTVKYNMYLDSKIVADGVASKTKLRQVANITATVNNAAFQSQSQSDTAGNAVGANAVVAGTTIKYTYAFTGSWSSYYTFNGWYTGDSTGPDYTNGYITDKQTLNYTPRKNVYIYAVGTRDLYINGNQYITGATENWNYKKNSSGKYLDSSGNVTTNTSNYVPVNYKMSFDPTLGTVGKYYWTITEDMYSRVSGTGYNFGDGVTKSGDYYYWSDSKNMGNAWFQFFDEAEGWNRDSVWYKGGEAGARLTQVYSDTTGKITYGRIRKASNTTDWKDQMGAFKFKEADSPGYSAPITIYYDPAGASGNFTVEPSYVYPNIYLSHGYAVGSTTRLATATGTYQSELKWLNGTTESDTNITGPVGNGWTPNHEGHVNHYKVTKKDATVRVKKTVNAADKVTAFFVYDLYDNKVYAIRDVSKSSNTYYADIKMQTGHDLYICPIIEAGGANMTVYFDATQLNSNRWGKIVSCYAWYGSGNAQGDFPGQPMIPSDDGTSWSATFPSTKSGSELAGITFSNYVDGDSTAGHSWLAMNGVMPSVTDNAAGTIDTSSSILKFKYNDMGTADNGNTQYRRINCKVQTYDYREPISYFKNNQEVDHAVNLTLTFAIKMGNSDSVMSLRHSELKTGSVNGSTASANIFSGITHTHSDGSETSTHKFTAKNFQYLTNAKGDQYTDLNGVPLGVGNKPSATYYVIAKGEVVYNNGNLEQVFWSGKRNQSKSAIGFYKTNDTISDNKDSLNTVPTGAGAVNETYTGASMDYGVEWYIYDADGNYITNILSAGYADYESLTGTVDTDSVVGSRLKELGYAVDGKSVAICYDKPRYMYTDDKEGNTKRINSGNYFDSFRATGQWYKNEAYQTATVSVGVAMMTDSGEVLAATNDGGYGNAWARYDTTKGRYASYASPTPLGNEYASVTAAQKDAVNTPIVLRASHDNFQGWYYYDPGTNVFTKASYTGYENFRPNYSKDIKYYAVYRAAAIYKYKYVGREGDDYYTVSGGDLTETELTDNLVRVNEAIRSAGGKYSVAALAPDDNKVSVFKRDFDFTQTTTKDNTTPYFLNVGTFENTVSSFKLTYYYPNSKGGNLASHSKIAAYGSTVDLQSIASTVTANAPEGQQFIGWYEYDPDATGDKYGNLLTTQSNYGFVITKAQTIAAKYASTAPTDDGVWQAYIDDNGITRQMNSSSTGKYYNDTIVRFRCGQNAATHVPNGAEVGVLIINDGGTNGNITANETQLNNFANNLTNGATGKVGSQGKTVTKLCKSITDANGSPLTYYNRYDFALRSDYSAAVETKYTVYAYVKINGSYKWSTVASGTYTATE